MWDKRRNLTPCTRHKSPKDNVKRKLFQQHKDGESSFDPQFRLRSRSDKVLPYLINSKLDNETRRKQTSIKRNKEKRDFVLLGSDMGGGFIKRRHGSKCLQLQKRFLTYKNASDNSKSALIVSIEVAANVTLFYSLFMTIRIITLLDRYSTFDMSWIVDLITDYSHIIGPLYVTLCPTFSSLLDPIIYLVNNKQLCDSFRKWWRK